MKKLLYLVVGGACAAACLFVWNAYLKPDKRHLVQTVFEDCLAWMDHGTAPFSTFQKFPATPGLIEDLLVRNMGSSEAHHLFSESYYAAWGGDEDRTWCLTGPVLTSGGEMRMGVRSEGFIDWMTEIVAEYGFEPMEQSNGLSDIPASGSWSKKK